eukprot:TRINITY_DN8424_c1_g2_i1.p1 TRINITY_DN8424_c1_g2~~TRINITY_DN8424_c1_g2_i1.p1  ORF type:complete len:199 (+),score=24.42 TRINITY_DN8424_c1_g2_i1:42-638(+)
MWIPSLLLFIILADDVKSTVNECSARPCGADQNCQDPDYNTDFDFLCSCVIGTGNLVVGGRATCIVTPTPPLWTFPPSTAPSTNGTRSKEEGDIWGPVTHGNKWVFLTAFLMSAIFCGVCSGYLFRRYGPKPSQEMDKQELQSRRPQNFNQPPEYSSVEVREEEVDGWLAQVRYDEGAAHGIPITYYDQEKGRWMPWA